MILIIVIITLINILGASETGMMGNIVTMTKIVILGFFILFGITMMLRTGDLQVRFTTDFMPNGFFKVFVAMGITFIAFEGYEIIAQSGEEALNPKHNIPRAIFVAIAIAVSLYILVSITAIGATTPPTGKRSRDSRGCRADFPIWDWRIGAACERYCLYDVGSKCNYVFLLAPQVYSLLGSNYLWCANVGRGFVHTNRGRSRRGWDHVPAAFYPGKRSCNEAAPYNAGCGERVSHPLDACHSSNRDRA